MTTASTLPNPIADLWRQARTWLAEALRDFRGPAAIAKTLAHTARAAIRARLMLIESLLMKLLLIEAARRQSSPLAGEVLTPAQSRGKRRGRCARTPQSRAARSTAPRRAGST